MTPRTALLACGAIALTGAIAVGHLSPAPWLINESRSVAPGLYRRIAEPPGPGRLVTLIPPPPGQAYLRSLGAETDARLLKRVAATGGEAICSDGRVLRWPRGSARAMASDRRGRRLPVWRGCRSLRADELLVIGESPTSFDSRYFGPISTAAVDGVYREVLRW